MKHQYIIYRGMERIEIEADSVGIQLQNGTQFELTYRTTDDEVSLSVSNGSLLIAPRASNVVRLIKAGA